MIIILKRNANPEKVEILKQELEHKGFKLHLSQGTQTSLIGLIGDTTAIHEDWLKAMDVVEDVRRIRAVSYTHLDVYKRQPASFTASFARETPAVTMDPRLYPSSFLYLNPLAPKVLAVTTSAPALKYSRWISFTASG